MQRHHDKCILPKRGNEILRRVTRPRDARSRATHGDRRNAHYAAVPTSSITLRVSSSCVSAVTSRSRIDRCVREWERERGLQQQQWQHRDAWHRKQSPSFHRLGAMLSSAVARVMRVTSRRYMARRQSQNEGKTCLSHCWWLVRKLQDEQASPEMSRLSAAGKPVKQILLCLCVVVISPGITSARPCLSSVMSSPLRREKIYNGAGGDKSETIIKLRKNVGYDAIYDLLFVCGWQSTS